MRRLLEVDDEELGQFEPRTQEAIMRLIRQQEEAAKPPPKRDGMKEIRDIKWPTHKEQMAKIDSQYKRGEEVQIQGLTELPLALRPQPKGR